MEKCVHHTNFPILATSDLLGIDRYSIDVRGLDCFSAHMMFLSVKCFYCYNLR